MWQGNVDVTGLSNPTIRNAVEAWAKGQKGVANPENRLFSVSLVFYLSKKRWKKDGLPKEDSGRDLDKSARALVTMTDVVRWLAKEKELSDALIDYLK